MTGLCPWSGKLRADRRREALEMVADAALVYRAELERDGQGHRGRLSMREDKLCRAIEIAAEDIKPGPITEDDLLIVQAMEDAVPD